MCPEEASVPPAPSSAKLSATVRGRWILVARAVWLGTAALLLPLFVAGIPVYFQHLRTECVKVWCDAAPTPPPGAPALRDLGLSATSYAAYYTALDVVVALAYLTIATMIFWRKPSERTALLGSFTLLIWGLVTVSFAISALTEAYSAWRPAYEYAQFLGLLTFTLFFYLFPDRRFTPRWTRWLATFLIAILMLGYLWPNSPVDYRAWPLPITGAFLLAWIASLIGVQVYRYMHVSDPVQRQQTKWVVFGVATALFGFFALVPLPEIISPAGKGDIIRNLITNTGMNGFMLLIPLSFGMAILRYRLWDIDVLINRTLVYGALTACVVAIYVLVVGYLGSLFHTSGNLVISLIATGLVAVLFAPLRDWLQRGVNRLMYGERDDPYGVISRLGQRLETTLDPRAVLPAVAETVAHALKLPHVAIELKRREEYETGAEYGRPAGEPLRLPLVYGTETVGRIVLSPRAPGEAFGPADRRLLEDLARQAGITAHAVRLTNDLQRSREHLVTAREEERRRLRRNLHDGLGPALSSAMLKLSAARRLLPPSSPADDLIVEVRDDMRTTVDDVRGIVYDLRPPVLDQLGLVPAIRDYAEQCASDDVGLRITVEAPEHLPPLPAAVEVAAYHIAREAITNAARHAQAHSCHIHLAIEDVPGRPELVLQITDDGVGMPTEPRPGVGLTSMRERAEELGGKFSVESPPEGGTRVLACLPVGKE
jgi:signal transduction histidine kinase